MQVPNAAPRDLFSVDQIVTLIQDCPSIRVDKGCELLDINLNIIEDISEDLLDGYIARNSYANLHASANFSLARPLDWGNAILRPYITIAGEITAAGPSQTIATTTSSTTAAMSDTFSGASVDTHLWTVSALGGTISEGSGVLSITAPATNTAEPHIESNATFDLTSSSAQAQCTDAGNQSLVTNEVYPVYLVLNTGNWLAWIIRQNQIIPSSSGNGVADYSDAITYVAASHKYFRIRENSGVTYWEVSADATTWLIVETRRNPCPVNSLKARLQAGPFSSEASSTTAKFDNFSIGVTTISSTTTINVGGGQITQTINARFNLGAYFASADRQTIEKSPRTYDVTGYDILQALFEPVGESYAIAASTDYLTVVEEILRSRGYTKYIIDQSSTGTLLPTQRSWAIDESVTWLKVVNDLLASIGYQGIWSDWDGRLRVEPYLRPIDRLPEWSYDLDPVTSMLDPKRELERDLFNAPNRWVAVRNNMATNVTPVEGNGVYTYVNQRTGPTSVEARGRTITKVFQVDAADQTSLQNLAQITIDSDIQVAAKLEVSTSVNPLHWHFDRVVYNDPDIGAAADVLVTEWTMPLNGTLMNQKWTIL